MLIVIQITKLSKMRLQDNLMLAQWLYAHSYESPENSKNEKIPNLPLAGPKFKNPTIASDIKLKKPNKLQKKDSESNTPEE